MFHRTSLLAASALLAACAQQPNAPGDSAANCAALAGQSPANTTVSRAHEMRDHQQLPTFCQLEGQIADKIGFVMRLPAADWNGKFVVAGCGGFCGSLNPDKPGYSNSLNAALRDGYAAIQTDSGHQAPSWQTDWALDDPRALELYAGAWMPLAVASGQALATSYYASAPRRTYFSGCSNGGRLGLFAAQRYPELFDGIAAGDGIFDLSGNGGIHGLWLLQTTRRSDGSAVISRDKIPLLSQHVMQRCDSLDGVSDNIVSRPELCDPAPQALQCSGQENGQCFTPEEVHAIKRLYQGATVDGQQLFPGINPGSEAYWPLWIVGTDDDMAWGERAGEGYLRLAYGIPASEAFKPHDYVLAEALEPILSLAPIVDATEPNLDALAAANTRLFYYQGLADPLIIPGRASEYFQQVQAASAPQTLAENLRFVDVPGFGHCWERTGLSADEFNPVAIIDRWVEQGHAPDAVRALQRNADGEVVRSRTLCALPARSVYRGGDPDKAESFHCELP
ncbi:tannase/feruloyl esterase family alpha/beta hydrolase [Seongchinamella sediminis]|uniref:Tannase/feruloyl esterase family alpha/beta hydrolase n=1 Tax=Seongchinamella sediminis TaxID=2283635 RepID=A0A3L7E2T2_9GAMM|nr:tannase/feruloyl esterase family alpha/beta hydrolase [Seongchinamella sediminis]RLQ22532.1 tannase/feruloyl esterase family alpha/beta hydrolase [Seongchinamella sediminis]